MHFALDDGAVSPPHRTATEHITWQWTLDQSGRCIPLLLLPLLVIKGARSSQAFNSSIASNIATLIAASVWGGVLVVTVMGGRSGRKPAVICRTVVLGACALSIPLLKPAQEKWWFLPIALAFVLAWLSWMEVADWVAKRLAVLVKAGLAASTFFLGGAIAAGVASNQSSQVAAITAALTMLGLSELALASADGRPLHRWNAVAQLSLATAPWMVQLAGDGYRTSTVIYCACVGVGLLIGRLSDERRQQQWETQTRQQLELRSDQDRYRVITQNTETAARLHDQTAALFSVETVMGLLHRQALGDDTLTLSPEEQAKLLESARDEIARARRLAKEQPLHTKECDLADLLGPSLQLIRAKSPQLSFDIRPGIKVRADGDALVDAIRNLVFNALDHGQGKNVRVTARATYEGYELRVSDEGPGVPAHLQSMIFERGFGSDRGGHGLANARSSLTQMGGSLQLVPSTTGAEFVVKLLAAEPQRVAVK
jgi:signal transduction histidine kinase